ncbi:tetratricopeptide repeat protein [Candidatus Auribacterota bacterium]
MRKIYYYTILILLCGSVYCGNSYCEIGDSYFAKGNDFYKQRKFDQAINMYQKAYDINKEYLGAVYNLGICYQAKGEFSKAINYFEKAVELNPMYLSSYIGLGLTYTRLGMYDKAIGVYKTAIDIDNDSYVSHLNLAAVYAKKEAYNEAIKEAKIALKINPKDYNGHLILGNIYFVMGDYKNAIDEYEWILKIEPSFVFARLHIGMAYSELGQFDKAIEYIEGSRSLVEDRGYVHYYLGKILLKKHEQQGADVDEAIRELKKAVEINPELIEVYLDIGKGYDIKNDTLLSIRYYRRYVESPLALEEEKREVNKIIKTLRSKLKNECLSP